jgi:hypothetical protein
MVSEWLKERLSLMIGCYEHSGILPQLVFTIIVNFIGFYSCILVLEIALEK